MKDSSYHIVPHAIPPSITPVYTILPLITSRRFAISNSLDLLSAMVSAELTCFRLPAMENSPLAHSPIVTLMAHYCHVKEHCNHLS